MMIKNSLRAKLSNFIKLQLLFVFATFLPLAFFNLYGEKYFALLLNITAMIIALFFYFLDRFVGSTKLVTILVVYAYSLVAAASISEDKASALYWFFPIALFCLFLMQPKAALFNILFIFLCLPTVYIVQHGFVHELVLYFASGFVFIGFSYSFVLSGIKIEKLVSTDHLTGLYNRRILAELDEFITLWQVAGSDELRLIVAVLDVNQFKEINDNHGHQFGDECLIKLADKLNNLTRKHKELFTARLGGDEFVAFGLVRNIETIKRELDKMSTFQMDLKNSAPLTVHTSYGFLDADPRLIKNSKDFMNILDQADAKMYGIKQKQSKKS